MQEKPKINVVWFRNDLRTRQQTSLASAFQEQLPVLGVYCFDPRQFAVTPYGFRKTERYRARFLIESVKDLQNQLSDLNVSLVIQQAHPADTFEELSQHIEIQSVFFQNEWTQEEYDTEQRVRQCMPWASFHGSYDQFLFHPDDIPYQGYRAIPEVFTEFRKKCEKYGSIRNLQPPLEKRQDKLESLVTSKIPTLSDLGLKDFDTDPRSAYPFAGGTTQAYRRMDYYFWNTHKLSNYKKTRNGLIGPDYSSKLSAWLANGSISALEVYYEIKQFEQRIKKNQDTYWLVFELIWRDYFKYISLKHGNRIFQLHGLKNHYHDWHYDEQKFSDWIHGNTGEPFVDSNMIEIAKTGYMSNRGRQNVNSFWAKEWKQDWRAGAAYFEAMLVDYDVHSNWGNWMYNSGVGNDPRDRKFNIQTQAARYDPDGDYRKLWLEAPVP